MSCSRKEARRAHHEIAETWLQGETDRRYAMVLSQTVKGMMASVAPVLGYALDAGAAELPDQAAAFPSHGLAAMESVLCHRVEHLRPLMDPRVLRRAAKDLWNSCTGVSSAGVPSCYRNSQICASCTDAMPVSNVAARALSAHMHKGNPCLALFPILRMADALKHLLVHIGVAEVRCPRAQGHVSCRA